MKTKTEINTEAIEIYNAIKEIMNTGGYDYCQSWWLNTFNYDLKSKLKTPQINQRAKLLVKFGYLTIDKSRTSTSTGVCYRLTEKELKDSIL